MLVDEMIALLAGLKIDLNAPVTVPTDNWAMACLIGRTVSLVNHGYEDHYDGMDWEDAAREVRAAIRTGTVVLSRNDILKIVIECGYDLKDYA